MTSSNIAIVIQARTGSTRLPNKVLKDIEGRPMIAFLVERLRRCKFPCSIFLATTNQSIDDQLADLGQSLGLLVVRGSDVDVLSRFAQVANCTTAKFFVRITGDCPFIDPDLLTEMINDFLTRNVDYYSNCLQPTYPDGLDIEIFTRQSLLAAQSRCTNTLHREHVTPWIRENEDFSFSIMWCVRLFFCSFNC